MQSPDVYLQKHTTLSALSGRYSYELQLYPLLMNISIEEFFFLVVI